MNKVFLYTRRTLAVLMLAGITLLLLDPTGQLRHWLGFMPKLQFLPAVLALNVGVVVAILLVTALIGRLYCSVVCPMGIAQDVFNWLGGRFLKKRLHYRRPATWVRYTVLVAFVALMLLGLNAVAVLIAPYSAYGRMLRGFFGGGVALVVSVVTALVIVVSGFFYGRLWCNTLCPVGSTLGLISRFSLFAPRIDASKCVGCRKCERDCKASCINIDNHTIDGSRCVDCWHCLNNCKFGALTLSARYGRGHKDERPSAEKVDASRRQFVATAAAVAAASALQAQEQKLDGGLAALQGKQVPRRQVPLKPFGSHGLKHFGSHCTSCQLCVSQCPEHILRPSTQLATFMQPELHYDQGYCRMACTRCSQVCPAGAIQPIDPVEKTAISIGVAVTLTANCLSAQGIHCGACGRHCPAGAIMMVPGEGGHMVPAVNESLCLGCGACEYYCPARPAAAIYVEGRERHKEV